LSGHLKTHVAWLCRGVKLGPLRRFHIFFSENENEFAAALTIVQFRMIMQMNFGIMDKLQGSECSVCICRVTERGAIMITLSRSKGKEELRRLTEQPV